MSESKRHDHVLHSIAEALGVPIEAFHDPNSSAFQQARDTQQLLVAFARISDPEARQSCIAFVRGLATGSSSTE